MDLTNPRFSGLKVEKPYSAKTSRRSTLMLNLMSSIKDVIKDVLRPRSKGSCIACCRIPASFLIRIKLFQCGVPYKVLSVLQCSYMGTVFNYLPP